ncbi:zf-HC2 domain-containing protein [Streptomyces sp. NPDC101194]|uniref:zf-HC2 domain-containing protein n=1 Tax=Streptomyces sp. NPDC101194 TaxID=3366127 RepID=UPI0037F32373
MLTAPRNGRTTSERAAEDHDIPVTAADEAIAVGAHLATCSTCRAGYDCSEAVPAHLFLLRQALADSTGRQQAAREDGGAEHHRVAPCRRGPVRTTGATQLTLSQWVSRTAGIGGRS